MSDSANEIDLDELLADAIAQDAVPDFRRMVLLEKRLEAAVNDLKTRGDGGLEGALNSVKAVLDYFFDRRPGWAAKGLLNPLLEALSTLQALKSGGSSRILICHRHKINHQPKTDSEQFYRGAICALIDEVKRRTGSKLDVARRRVAGKLRFHKFPVGRIDSEDITTLKNWRNQAKSGTVAGTQYANTKSMLAKIDGSAEAIIDAMLKALSGIFPQAEIES